MSFSAAFETEKHRRQVGAAAGVPQRKSDSPVLSLSPRSDPAAGEGVSNALSSGSGSGFLPGGGGPAPPVVEDALRARAEQAESAAERLLELVEPEEEGLHHSSIPTSLLVGSAGTNASAGGGVGAGAGASVGIKEKPVPVPLPLPATTTTTPPATPVSNRNAAIMRQAAMFKDSPAYKGSSSSSSLLDVLRDRKHESGWWMKRMKGGSF
jgi:CLIP-associating protein 1/2